MALPIGMRGAAKRRAWLDPAKLEAVLNNVMHTFAEAHARSVASSTSPSRRPAVARSPLLSHLTTPDVWVLGRDGLTARTVPAMLHAGTAGGSVPHIRRTLDRRSLYADLPNSALHGSTT